MNDLDAQILTSFDNLEEVVSMMSYFGGKANMIGDIKNFIREDTTDWYELFAGGASVSLNLGNKIFKTKWLNDVDYDVYNILDLMSKPVTAEKLIERLYRLEYSKSTYDMAKRFKKIHYIGLDRIERAAMEFVLITQSFSATRNGFSKRWTTEQYQKHLHKNLPKILARLKDFKITNKDAIDIIRDKAVADNETGFLYLDVPYEEKYRTRGGIYTYDTDDIFQMRLLASIADIKCPTLLCGYREPLVCLYDKWLRSRPQWHLYKIKTVVKSSSSQIIKPEAEEYVWCNYDLPSTAVYEEQIY